MWFFFIFIALEYTVGISLSSNSPCKIASEILRLPESSSSQQPAKAAATAAYCQPELVVKMVKPPCCHQTTLPCWSSAAFWQHSPPAIQVPKLPSANTAPERCRVSSKLRRGVQPHCLLELLRKTRWLSRSSQATMMCQGVLCLGKACKIVKRATK